ncbi:hypothetical protein DFH06DRAFT_1318193 [Mycena polygramma]|nr:hypothetical protein DFH06DRAFT_1318173 [Mycena polygramma]KAJ7676052.1 hypothetical protein DFH06DRAFT_1318193 [Mycena polygramma]
MTTSLQETRRLFGPHNRPQQNTNVRQRASLRKALELSSRQDLEAALERTVNLRMAMGLNFTANQFGKVTGNFEYNGHRLFKATLPPPPEEQQHLRDYLVAYDAYFKKRGNDYAVRDPSARDGLQAAEQTWHDWMVRYRLARGMGPRPDWALEPLPGLQRVRVTPPPRAIGSSARPAATLPLPHGGVPLAVAAVPAPQAFPHLPTPPPRTGLGSQGLGSIDMLYEVPEPVHTPRKRKFLGVIEISDSENDEPPAPPHKKQRRFLGFVDLTN